MKLIDLLKLCNVEKYIPKSIHLRGKYDLIKDKVKARVSGWDTNVSKNSIQVPSQD